MRGVLFSGPDFRAGLRAGTNWVWEWAYVERAVPDVGIERAVLTSMQQRLVPVWLLQVMERGETDLDTAALLP